MPFTIRPGWTSVRRYLPKPLSSVLLAGWISFVTFGNVPPWTPLPAPKSWYCASQSFESAPGSDHPSERRCSSAARIPAVLLTFADPSGLK